MLKRGHETQQNRETATSFEEEAMSHRQAVYAYALRLVSGDTEEAEEFTQETMFRAYRAWDSFRPGTNCRAWLMTIVRNVVFADHARRTRWDRRDRLVVGEFKCNAADGLQDPETGFYDGLIDPRVERAVERLPAIGRQAVIMKDVHGLRYDEIAHRLGIAVGTVKSRLFRARRALQGELYEYAVAAGHIPPREESVSAEFDLAA